MGLASLAQHSTMIRCKESLPTILQCVKKPQNTRLSPFYLLRLEEQPALVERPTPVSSRMRAAWGNMPGYPSAALFVCGWLVCENATFHDL